MEVIQTQFTLIGVNQKGSLLDSLHQLLSRPLFAVENFLQDKVYYSTDETPNTSEVKRSNNSKNKFLSLLKSIGFVVIAGLVVFGIVRVARGMNTTGQVKGTKVEIAPALKTKEINHNFDIPIRDAKGNEIGKLKAVIEKAEIRDEIVHKGQRGRAVEGRTFLVLSLKMTNDLNQPIELPTSNYIRLSVNGNDQEWLAPKFNNDNVLIQAQSTEYAILGFSVNDSDINSMRLRIGEINGEKETIDLKFE